MSNLVNGQWYKCEVTDPETEQQFTMCLWHCSGEFFAVPGNRDVVIPPEAVIKPTARANMEPLS